VASSGRMAPSSLRGFRYLRPPGRVSNLQKQLLQITMKSGAEKE